MPIRFVCPRCQTPNSWPNETAGTTVACPQCSRRIAIPKSVGQRVAPAVPVATFEEDAPDEPTTADSVQHLEDVLRTRSGQSEKARSRELDPTLLAGVVVAWVFASIGSLWNLISLHHTFFERPTAIEQFAAESFPAVSILNLFIQGFAELSNALLLVGAILTFLGHPKGRLTVVVTCVVALAISTIDSLLLITFVVGSEIWARVDSATKGGFIGAVIGAFIVSLLFYAIVLLLFRSPKPRSL